MTKRRFLGATLTQAKSPAGVLSETDSTGPGAPPASARPNQRAEVYDDASNLSLQILKEPQSVEM